MLLEKELLTPAELAAGWTEVWPGLRWRKALRFGYAAVVRDVTTLETWRAGAYRTFAYQSGRRLLDRRVLGFHNALAAAESVPLTIWPEAAA